LADSEFCFWHDPDHAEEAEQARRLGGQRRRREKITEGAYEIDGIDALSLAERIVKIAIVDTLSLENSVNRNRTLISASIALAKLTEVGEQEERLAAVESALGPRLVKKGHR
jgi:hypothetical protein